MTLLRFYAALIAIYLTAVLLVSFLVGFVLVTR